VRTFVILLFASSWTRSIIRFFLHLGVFGPFLLEALDSSFLYLPLANELLLVALITSASNSWMWTVYAAMAALGSLVGVLLTDSLMRKAGEKGLEKFVNRKRAEWLKVKLEHHTGWVIFIASAMPPPFPFRAVVLTASALQSPRKTLLRAVFTGRLLRFSVEALLIVYFGRTLLVYLNSDALEYVMYALASVAIVGSVLTFYKWISSGRDTQEGTSRGFWRRGGQ
jgi:membrane protein YqaA with SNARE-associated domain